MNALPLGAVCPIPSEDLLCIIQKKLLQPLQQHHSSLQFSSCAVWWSVNGAALCLLMGGLSPCSFRKNSHSIQESLCLMCVRFIKCETVTGMKNHDRTWCSSLNSFMRIRATNLKGGHVRRDSGWRNWNIGSIAHIISTIPAKQKLQTTKCNPTQWWMILQHLLNPF